MALASQLTAIAKLCRAPALTEMHDGGELAALPLAVSEVDARLPGGLTLGHLRDVIEDSSPGEYPTSRPYSPRAYSRLRLSAVA